ncbi:hypothetical protein LLG95_16025 [bacterium]|nr:hypothetical protein [bacterium]
MLLLSRSHNRRQLARWTLMTICLLLAAAPAVAQDKPLRPTSGTTTAAPEVLMESAATPSRVGGTAPSKSEALPTTAPPMPKVSLFVHQLDMQKVLDRIREATGVTVEARGKTTGVKIDLAAENLPLDQVLERITKPNNFVWIQRSPTSYQIYDQETYTQEVTRNQTIRTSIQLHYINATDLEAIIKPMLTEGVETSSADARTNRLIVQALPDKIAVINDIASEFDVQLYSMVFEIANADTDEIGSRLQEIASESAEIQIDPINRVIVVKDTFERIKQMEQLVALLDRDQEIVAYNLNNLGMDGEMIEQIVQKFIEPIITKDAMMDFNYKLGRLIVRDVHSVHKKIQDVLKSLDTPRKQVLIEGELLSVQITDNLSLGSSWVISNDLQTAMDNAVPNVPTTPVPNRGLPSATIGSSGLTFLDIGKNYRVELTAALNNSDTRILLRPRLLIASGETGNVSIGEEQPVLNTFYNNYNTNVTNNYQSSSQSMVNTGLQIDIQPTITNRGLIEMYIAFDNSTPIIVADIGNGTRGVGRNSQRAETYMLMPSGETRVIGGLISHNKSETSAGVPYLSKIPYFGWLFGNRTDDNSMRNLMFFITATVVQEKATNEDLAEPVNEAARVAMAEVTEKPAAPAELHKIPAELIPYLKSIRPEAVPYSGAAPTTATTPSVLYESGAPTAQPPSVTSSVGQGLLTAEPYKSPRAGETLRVGGAVPTTSASSVGPTGTFGASKAGAGTRPGLAKTPTTAKATPGPAGTPAPGVKATPGAKATPAATRTPRAYRTPRPQPTPPGWHPSQSATPTTQQ